MSGPIPTHPKGKAITVQRLPNPLPNTINRETQTAVHLYAVELFEVASKIITRADEESALALSSGQPFPQSTDILAGHALREHFESINPLAGTDTIFTDFLTDAISRINWQQVAVFVRAKMARLAELERHVYP